MNRNMKNLISIIIVVACALNVACNKINKYKTRNIYSFSDVGKFESITVSSKSEYFVVEIEDFENASYLWRVDKLPAGIYCLNCKEHNIAETVDHSSYSRGALSSKSNFKIFEFSIYKF